jgi:mannose-1-phosphate guanylyltransferase
MPRSHSHQHRWGVILAGGDGVRLRPLTRLVSGDERPKQFCPLFEGQTLLTRTRTRVEPEIDPDRTLLVLNGLHQPFYSDDLSNVPASRMVVQPCNRGTLPAILLALRHLVRLDEQAVVGFFPSDHHYAREKRFMAGVAAAFEAAEANPGFVLLLGALAKYPEVDFGWIEPEESIAGRSRRAFAGVRRFWEKPSLEVARALLDRGCLWNTFVMAGRVQAFMEMIESAAPNVYKTFESMEAPNAFYDGLANGDFSREVLAVSTANLAVMCPGDVGWSDLGDPSRVIEVACRNGVKDSWAAHWLRDIAPAAASS